jgi:hypothetical protein
MEKLEKALGIKVSFNTGTYEAYCTKFPSRSVIGHGPREVEAKYDLVCKILLSTSTQLQTALRILEKDPDIDYRECSLCGLKEVLEVFTLIDDLDLCKTCAVRHLYKLLKKEKGK